MREDCGVHVCQGGGAQLLCRPHARQLAGRQLPKSSQHTRAPGLAATQLTRRSWRCALRSSRSCSLSCRSRCSITARAAAARSATLP